MIEIGYLSDYPFYVGFGGKEIQLLNYLKYINKSSNVFKIKLLNHWNKRELDGIEILHLFGHNHFYHIYKLLKNNARHKKIILSPTIYYQGWKFGKFAFFIGSNLPFPNFYRNIKFEIENSDLVIVNSNSEKEKIFKTITSNARIEVIHNAIEDDFLLIKDDEKDDFLKKFNLEKFSYVLTVGMLDERKNSINMIKAFLNVQKDLDKKLVIIGSPRFSKKENYDLSKKLIDNNKSIIHIPYINKETELNLLKSAYYNCAFHYLPSHIETPGISNLEALSYGKNILVGKCSPVEEYFGNHAVYCNSKIIESIERALVECNKMSYYNEANKELVKSNFIYSKVIKKLLKIYEDIKNK
jgi:glycosyltransferase involved in cell wall biosynthesis